MSWLGCLNGSGRSRTVSITLKIALFAPMPRARVKMAMAVKPGAFANIRSAYFRSVSMIVFADLLCAQRLDRIDQCGSTRRQQAREKRGGGEQYGRAAE